MPTVTVGISQAVGTRDTAGRQKQQRSYADGITVGIEPCRYLPLTSVGEQSCTVYADGSSSAISVRLVFGFPPVYSMPTV